MPKDRSFCLHALGRINLDHIKPRLQVALGLLQPQKRRRAQTALLAAVDKFPRLAVAVVLAEFDLHKRDDLFGFGDDVDLAEPCAIIAGDDLIPLLPGLRPYTGGAG